MSRLLPGHRLAPIVAGVAGLVWFWAELAPQRTGFEDTDNPATGLAFIAAHPEAWRLAGYSLVIFAIAFVVTVLAVRDRLLAGAPNDAEPDRTQIGVETLSVVGLFAAAMLLGMGCVRLSGGPIGYVQGLDQAWGEMAYMVTQFVGTQLLGVGGLGLLAAWIAGVAIVGVRRRAVPLGVAAFAVVPAIRLLALPDLTFLPEGFWFVLIGSIPAAFLWMVLLGMWPAAGLATGRRGTSRDVAPLPSI